MNHFKLTKHTDRCIREGEDYKKALEKNKDEGGFFFLLFDPHDHCSKNPEHFLFFYDHEFILVSYSVCLQGYHNNIDYKEDILQSFVEVYKQQPWRVRRSHEVNRDMKEFRLRGANLNLDVDVISYNYENAARKEWAFTYPVRYSDFNHELVEENYFKAKEYLLNNGYSHLVSDLDYLKKANNFQGVDQVEEVKCINELTKIINRKIKKRNETSKQ